MSISALLDDISIPDVTHIKYSFSGDSECDPLQCYTKISNQLNRIDIRKGARIGIAVGSRGIHMLPDIIKCIVDEIKEKGAIPFVFPAMGSHGGATAEGQRQVLQKLGITTDHIGCEICSTMDTVQIGTSSLGLPVFMDKHAWNSDGVIVVNRVKPHTTFHGKHESGIIKMLVIGMGKQKGAEKCHQLGFINMARNIEDIAKVVLQSGKILLGIALVENHVHKICHIETALPQDFFNVDERMLKIARRNLPGLPFEKVDVLVINEIGKEISGTGFDTNVVGRLTGVQNGHPDVTRITVLNLSQKTAGNGNGIGRADTTTKKVLDKFNFEETYPNAITSTAVESVKLPMILANDQQAIKAAIKMSLIADYSNVKLALIKNTAQLEDIYISETLLKSLSESSSIKIFETNKIMFDENGNIINGYF